MGRTWIGFLLAGIAAAGSETPPPGAPLAARLRRRRVSLAEKTSRPIFVYLTKTY